MTGPLRPRPSWNGDVSLTVRGRNQGAAVDINSTYRRGEKYERDVRVVDLFESHRQRPGRRRVDRVRPAIDVTVDFD